MRACPRCQAVLFSGATLQPGQHYRHRLEFFFFIYWGFFKEEHNKIKLSLYTVIVESIAVVYEPVPQLVLSIIDVLLIVVEF